MHVLKGGEAFQRSVLPTKRFIGHLPSLLRIHLTCSNPGNISSIRVYAIFNHGRHRDYMGFWAQ